MMADRLRMTLRQYDLITTATDWAPWVQDLTPDAAADLRGRIALALSAWATGALLVPLMVIVSVLLLLSPSLSVSV